MTTEPMSHKQMERVEELQGLYQDSLLDNYAEWSATADIALAAAIALIKLWEPLFRHALRCPSGGAFCLPCDKARIFLEDFNAK